MWLGEFKKFNKSTGELNRSASLKIVLKLIIRGRERVFNSKSDQLWNARGCV